MTSHTPGPWRLEGDRIGHRKIRADARRCVVTIDMNTTEPDARLLAAAPDMADALADCIVSFCAANLEHLPSFAKARAALAKALPPRAVQCTETSSGLPEWMEEKK